MPDSYSTTNLIINNIPSATSDEILNKLFNKFGSIKSCKIIRSTERDDKAYGFCEYNDPKSAKNALLHLDGYKQNDRILKVSYAKLFPKPKGKCIEVMNLPFSTQEESLRKYFSQFGRISRLRLISNDSVNSKTAEIVYDNKHEADKAAVKSSIRWNYDNCKPVNVVIKLSASDRSFKSHDYREVQPQGTAPIVYGNLNSHSQLGDNYFYIQRRSQTAFTQNPYDLSQLNNIIACGSLGSIYQNAVQLSPLGTGYYPNHAYTMPLASYPAIENNDKAIHSVGSFNGAPTIPYSLVYPQYGTFVNANNSLSVGIPFMYTTLSTNSHPCKTVDANVVEKLQPTKNDWYNRSLPKNNWVVYVYNIGNSTNGEQLRELFAEKFDKDILRVDVPKDMQNGSNKNFGFVTFKTFNSAQLAIDEMNGKDFQGKSLQVSFKK